MSSLQIRDWLDTLRWAEIHIPSVHDVEQEIRKKYWEIIFRWQIDSAIVSSPFWVRFALPTSREQEWELLAQEVRWLVKPEDLEDIDTILLTEDLTQKTQRKYNDCFIISPPLNQGGLSGNPLVDAEKYWCDVEYTSLWKIVRLKISEGQTIQITSDNF